MFHVKQIEKMEEIKNCKICGNEEFSSFLKCKDHFLSQETFNLVKCNFCGFVFINPRPEKLQLPRYYDSPEYISHSGTEKGIVNSIYKKVRKHTHKRKVNLISKYSQGKSILDIGCGSGELLGLFKQCCWETLGVEPNQSARDFAKSTYNLEVIDEPEISDIPTQSKEVISMWHVLEHVSELNERMKEIKRILKDNGVLFIAVPNMSSYDAEYYKKFWAAYDVPRHLYQFTPDIMKKLLEKHKFSVIKILPMKFDSYYVSMLSEKYKTGKNNLIRALYIGFLSNFKACNNKTKYSSQIYVIKNI
jgi:2-polyprenyl-3-methyl-5-hydroxy-6-metoxy-1,4-benzoquinol methylase